jgi:hypothetical protein
MPWSIASTVHPSKKETQKSSNGGGDKNPPRINIDSSHKVPLTKKIKNNAGHAEEPETKSGKLQIEIEVEQMQKIGSSAVDISDTEFFDIDEPFVIQSTNFDSQSKSMVIQKRDVTNRIDFSQMSPSKICSFHQVTGDVLHDSIGGMETDYANNEFEQAFIATLEFFNRLAKIVPSTTAAKMKLSSTLLACSKSLVENNINKRMQLVTEVWETTQNLVSFEKKANDLLEHLEVNLTNEQLFGHQVLDPFANYALNTSELKRRQEKLPSPKRTKKVKSCWQKKIENLPLIVKSCKQVISKKENLLQSLLQMDLTGTTNEVQDTNLILKSLPVTKEAFQEQVDILKGLSFEKFYGILEHRLDEHKRCVLDYAYTRNKLNRVCIVFQWIEGN